MSMATILQALKNVGPMTGLELCRHLGTEQGNLARSMQRLRREGKKQVYIRAWEKPERQGRWAPVYALGDLPDKEPPRAKTRSEISRAYNKRHALRISVRRYGDRGKAFELGVWSGLVR